MVLRIFLFGLIALFSCRQSGQQDIPADVVTNPATASGGGDTENMPVIAFQSEEHDFQKVYEGETVSYSFKFSNKGRSDLLLSSVSSSCGCTVTNYSQDPVPPGAEGSVQVLFKSEGRRGFQQKTVTVISNARNNKQTLTIKAMVMPPGQ